MKETATAKADLVQKSEENFKKAMSIEPDNPPAHRGLGLLYMREQRYGVFVYVIHRCLCVFVYVIHRCLCVFVCVCVWCVYVCVCVCVCVWVHVYLCSWCLQL